MQKYWLGHTFYCKQTQNDQQRTYDLLLLNTHGQVTGSHATGYCHSKMLSTEAVWVSTHVTGHFFIIIYYLLLCMSILKQ